MAKSSSTQRPAQARARAASPAAPSGSSGAPIGLILGIVALIVLGVGLVAFAASRSSDDGEAADEAEAAGLEQTRPVTFSGEALPQLLDGQEDAAIGASAPVVNGASFDGTPIAVEADGQPTLVVFLAHWCPHCQREVPVLVDWFQSGGVPEGVQVIGVATSTDPAAPNYPPSAWLEREGFPWPVLADNENNIAASAMGLTGYPYFVLLDADGTVVTRASGEVDPTVLQTQLEELLAGA